MTSPRIPGTADAVSIKNRIDDIIDAAIDTERGDASARASNRSLVNELRQLVFAEVDDLCAAPVPSEAVPEDNADAYHQGFMAGWAHDSERAPSEAVPDETTQEEAAELYGFKAHVIEVLTDVLADLRIPRNSEMGSLIEQVATVLRRERKLKTIIEDSESRRMEERDVAEARVATLTKALAEIAEGAGRFSSNRLEHAENCIEDMKGIATAALASVPTTAGLHPSDDEVWAAYRAGYLNGVSEPKATIEGYEAWCALAEAGASAYVAVLKLNPVAARASWIADRREISTKPSGSVSSEVAK